MNKINFKFIHVSKELFSLNILICIYEKKIKKQNKKDTVSSTVKDPPPFMFYLIFFFCFVRLDVFYSLF